MDTVYVDETSLTERQLTVEQLQPPVTLLSQKQVAERLQQYPKVLSF